MSSRYHGDILVSDGTYQKDGQEKKRWQKVGAAFINDHGNISFKLDYIPIKQDFSGWFNIFEKDQQQPIQQMTPQQEASARGLTQHQYQQQQSYQAPPVQQVTPKSNEWLQNDTSGINHIEVHANQSQSPHLDSNDDLEF